MNEGKFNKKEVIIMAYDERFVAFLDILGFKSIIGITQNDVAYQEKIKQILNYIAGIRNDNYHGLFSEDGILKEVSVFSDSIVISYSTGLNIGGGLFHVLMDLIYICNDLLAQNIYIRGAVTCGQMYHDKKICFGPAMVQAYDLEERVAIHPRIIIDTYALQKGLQSPGKANTMEMEGEYLDSIICCDEDGTYFLDFLSQYEEFNDISYYENYLKIVKENLTVHLNTSYPTNIFQKYQWFAAYYNNTIKKVYKSHSPDSLITL